MEKTFADCSGIYNYYVGVALAHAQRTRIHETCELRISRNFAEKTFADGSETAKNAKLFSLEGFPLYGTSLIQIMIATIITVSAKEVCQGDCAP